MESTIDHTSRDPVGELAHVGGNGTRVYTYGPVPSRRLGRSLGVDVLRTKACPLNCVYCELGRTRTLTLTRREYTPPADVIKEVVRVANDEDGLKFITISGSGEPTLHSGLGTIIRAVKQQTTTPVAVLTSGVLLFDRSTRQDLLEADLVIPSLDAVSWDVFHRVNRPHRQLNLGRVLDGLVQFRQEYSGQLWVEILFVRGMNDSDEEARRMRHMLERIQPDRVQIHTVARPPAEIDVEPVDIRRLYEIAEHIANSCEVIWTYNRPCTHESTEDM